MRSIIRAYVREFLLEMVDGVQEDDSPDGEDVQEFSAVGGGAIAGFTAPLGMTGDDMRSGLKKRRKKV